jgi:hypothetical protein
LPAPAPALSLKDEAGPPGVTPPGRFGAGVTFRATASSFPVTSPRPYGGGITHQGEAMTRIPAHTIEDAPEATRSLLAELVQFSPSGRLLNMHAQMAHSPAVLEAYVSIRRAASQHGTLDQQVRTALMLTAATAGASQYALSMISLLALRAGWSPGHVQALRAGGGVGNEKTDSLIAVVREAAGSSGLVSDATWAAATGQGWGDDDLAEAFAYLGLTVFTSYFLNYAGTDLDVPAAPAPAGEAG